MKKIETAKAPEALGPYSQAVKVDTLVFVSGQLPIDPKTMQMVEGDIGILTERIIRNLEAILAASGSSLDKVVRCDVFLTDLKHFKAMNEEYNKHFKGQCPPARQTVQVAALPMNSPIEISCIATT